VIRVAGVGSAEWFQFHPVSTKQINDYDCGHPGPALFWFQFHSDSTKEINAMDNPDRNAALVMRFNSTLVRLSRSTPLKTLWILNSVLEFQFHSGSTKQINYWCKDGNPCNDGFNSTLVRISKSNPVPTKLSLYGTRFGTCFISFWFDQALQSQIQIVFEGTTLPFQFLLVRLSVSNEI
jgi:hypothetical protein